MPATTRNNLRYPVAGDAATLWTYIENLAKDVDGKGLFRGSGGDFPSAPVVGDTFFHTIHKCEFVYVSGVTDGAAWRQTTVTQINVTISQHIAALTAAGLTFHYGQLIYEVATRNLYVANSGNTVRPASPQDYANTSVNAGNSEVTNFWNSTTYVYTGDLGAKITIPGDGVTRTVKMIATCNIAGDGWLRIRADGGTTRYWPNANGKRSIAAANQEQDLTFLGRLQHTGTVDTVIYLEAKSTTANSGKFIIPVLDVTAY